MLYALMLWIGTASAPQASGPINFIDATAIDPLSHAKALIGSDDAAFKRTFPANKGFAFNLACPSHVLARHRGKSISRVEIWNYPLAQGCGQIALETLTRLYGTPRSGGYGYSRAIGITVLSTRIETFTWTRDGYDVILMRQNKVADSSFIIHVLKEGTWNPGTG